MHSSLSFLAAALAYTTMAQTSTFEDMAWGNVTVGQAWPIHWTVGDGTPVSLFLGNATVATPYPIFTGRDATDEEYEWTVALPDGWVPGSYALALVQSGAMDYSALFDIMMASVADSSSSTSPGSTMMTTPAPSVTANATLISASAERTVTVTYWDEDCGCHKTSAIPAPAATGTGLPGTQYTWWDESCGCTKTAVAPAPTQAPACPGSPYGCNNYTAPATSNMPPPPPSSMAATPSQSRYTGGSERLASSALAAVGLIMAAMLS